MDKGMSYRRFGLMIVTSTVVMFGLMYLNTYALEHVRYSQTRTWMALVMGATMAVIMLGFMWGMYRDRRANLAILAAAALVFAGALGLARSQATVGDVAYMKAMIPHHSIAVMTSERAQIQDPRVRRLADRILEAQVREIAEMEALVAELEASPPPADAPVLESYRTRGAPPPPPAG
jgi:FlaA1/EpsC-like NDP-sugar epimerase